MFPFGKAATPANTTTPTGPAPFAPPSGPASPISVAQALQGFGDAQIDTRDPFLPVGFAGKITTDRTTAQSTRNLGLCLYAYAKVDAIAAPGGGMVANLKGCNASPASVGSMYAIRISGFSKEDARAFAMSDLKAFMWALLEPEFKAQGCGKAEEIPPATWDQMAQAWAAGDPHFAGKSCLVQTSVQESKAGFSKLKVHFYPLSAQG